MSLPPGTVSSFVDCLSSLTKMSVIDENVEDKIIKSPVTLKLSEWWVERER